MTEEYMMSASELAQLHAEALRLRREAEARFRQAEEKDRDGEYKLGQAEHRLRDVRAMEANFSKREAKLKELGEDMLLAREAAAEAKFAEARELMKSFDREKNAAAIYLRQCGEREAAAREKAEREVTA